MTIRLNATHRLLIGFFLFFPAFCVSAAGAQDSAPKGFYYYNPDSMQGNLGGLAAAMDALLREAASPVKFQAFSRYSDFEQTINKHSPAFLIAPDWYIKRQGQKLRIVQLLTPIKDNSRHYTKLLIVKKGSGVNFSSRRTYTLAMTPMGHDAEAQLNGIIFSRLGYDASQLTINFVPKDSDALHALLFGQLDMALVTSQNVAFIKKTNENILKQLEVVAESTPLPFPTLCYISGQATPDEIKQMKAIFQNHNKRKTLVKILELLQIDEWQSL